MGLVSVFSLFGITSNSYTDLLIQFQNYFLGLFAAAFPVIPLFTGIWLLKVEHVNFRNIRFIALFFIFVLCLTGTAHNIFVPVDQELYPDKMPDGGGFVGGSFVLLLHKLIGYQGSWIVLCLLWVLFIAVTLPVKNTIKWLYHAFKPAAADSKYKKDDYDFSSQDKSRQFKSENKFTRSTADYSVDNIYRQKEFASFTDGIHKKSSFRKILSFTDKSAYSDKKIKSEIKDNPVQIPEWEERKTTVIVRPYIDYDLVKEDKSAEAVKYYSHDDKDTDVDSAKSVQKEMLSLAEEKHDDQKINHACHEQNNTEPKQKIVIFDSAEKVNMPAVSEVDKPANEMVFDAEDDRYIYPEVGLLDVPKVADPSSFEGEIIEQCSILEQTLADFRVKASVVAVTRGPSVTRFELEPAPGVKVSSVVNLADDIALKLAASGVRIEAPIPGKAAIGIEVPNIKNDPVYFREVVDNKLVYGNESKLCIGLGKNISGDIITADLAKMPHLLVAGSTGSGKSVCINTIIAGLLYKASPDEVKLILVDPKVVELSNYNGIPHLLTPVVTDAKKAASALHWAVGEMERRYKLFAESHVREINSYNVSAQEKLPFIVIIIDELSDLMMVAKVDVEDAILRLAQKARAAGIHLILATQRPSVDVITGIVKANIPSRIAFAVSSQTDSRTILDMGGAEKLLGKGDMLYYPIGQNKPVRVQGAFVSDAELNRIVDFIIKQSIPVNYSDEITSQNLESDNKTSSDNTKTSVYDDDLFEDALQLVMDMGQASSSMLQRRFRIGYTRAARLVDMMEELGIISQSAGSKPREVILSRQEIEERFLKHE